MPDIPNSFGEILEKLETFQGMYWLFSFPLVSLFSMAAISLVPLL